MRRAVGTITDLEDGRFRISVSVGYDKRGKRIRPSETVRGTRREAERALATAMMRYGKLAPDKITIEAFLDDVWLPTKDSRRRLTRENYASKIRSLINPYLGQIQLKALDAYIIERWMVDLARDGKSAQTIVHARGVLKNAMRAAVRWKLIDRDPTEGTERPAVKYEPVVLTAEQMTDYLKAFTGHVIEPVVLLAIAGGLRRSEACAVDWRDIDFDAGTVAISKGLHQRGSDVWPEEPKSRTSRRTIGLPEWTMARLRVLRGVGPLVIDGGRRMAPEKVARLYDKQVAASELPRVPLRDLRNSHGTFLYDSGIDIALIADRLGHSDTSITRAHYIARSHANAERVSVAALEPIGACHLVPNLSAEHGQNPAETVTGSAELLDDAL